MGGEVELGTVGGEDREGEEVGVVRDGGEVGGDREGGAAEFGQAVDVDGSGAGGAVGDGVEEDSGAGWQFEGALGTVGIGRGR